MRKRLLGLFLVFISTITLASCGKKNAYYEIKNSNTVDVLLTGREITYTYNEKLSNTVHSYIEKLDKAFEDEKLSVRDFKKYFNMLSDINYDLDDDYLALTLLYDVYHDDIYLDLIDEVISLQGDIEDLKDRHLYDAKMTKYKYVFYKLDTDAAIDEYLSSLSEDADKISGLYSKVSSLQNELLYLNDNEEIYNLHKELKAVGDEYARATNYVDYQDYLYRGFFGRTYTYTDINDVNDEIINYIVPASKKLEEKEKELKSSLTPEEKQEFNDLINFFFGYYDKKLIQPYLDFAGDMLTDSYHYLFDEQRFYFSDKKNDSSPAYANWLRDGAVLYMSKGCQEIGTFIHELGHFNAFYNSSNWDMDFMEVQSQDNEILFAMWLKEQNIVSEKVAELYYVFTVNNILSQVPRNYGEAIEFVYLYENHDLPYNNIIVKMKEMDKIYGSYFDYNFACYLQGYDCYTISYAVSAYSALSLLFMDLNDARDTYKLIGSTEKQSYKESVAECGLFDFFDETTYKQVYDYFCS